MVIYKFCDGTVKRYNRGDKINLKIKGIIVKMKCNVPKNIEEVHVEVINRKDWYNGLITFKHWILDGDKLAMTICPETYDWVFTDGTDRYKTIEYDGEIIGSPFESKPERILPTYKIQTEQLLEEEQETNYMILYMIIVIIFLVIIVLLTGYYVIKCN